MGKYNKDVFTGLKIMKSDYSGTLAFGSFRVSESFDINFTLKETNGEKWVALPSRKDANGQYKKQVWPVVDESLGVDMKQEMEEFVIEGYNTQILQRSKSQGAPVANKPIADDYDDEEEAPF